MGEGIEGALKTRSSYRKLVHQPGPERMDGTAWHSARVRGTERRGQASYLFGEVLVRCGGWWWVGKEDCGV